MLVRGAGPDDADAFARVIAEVAAERDYILTEPPVDAAELALRVRATIDSGRDPLWVLEDEGRVVGTLGLHATRADGVVSLGMSIAAASRRRGGGRMMMAAALGHARAEGLHKIELEVFVDNAPAIALYAGHGFTIEGVRREHYLRADGSRRSVLVMALLVGEGARPTA